MKENEKLVGRSLKDLMEEHNVDKLLDNEIIVELNLDKIIPNPNQPRTFFDEKKIKELQASIKEHGVFQPIIVKKQADNYIIVAGERRFRAAKANDLKKIPAVVRNYSDLEVAEISLVENLQRENLSAIEEAQAYQAIIDGTKMTHEQLAKKVSKSRSHITNILGLLKLPESVKELVNNKKLSMGHARTLSKLDDEKEIIKLANKIIDDNLTVREIEAETFSKLKSDKTNKKNYNRTFKEERNVLKKYYGSQIFIRGDRVTFKIEDEDELKSLIEKLMKNAL